jgi:predicted MFS family arabinose efflux permease
LARIVGPAIGALVLAVWGPAWCFLLNGISFIAVIISLFVIKVTPYIRQKSKKSNMLVEIKDGLKYITHERHLFQTIILILVAGIFVFNYEVLVPVFTKNILHQGEQVYGFLMSSLGIGSLLGALIVSMKGKSIGSSKILFLSLITVSILLILIGLTRTYYLTVILLVLSGITNLWFNTTANVMLQLTAKDEYRGRVMSVFSLVNSGTAPLGYMISGAAADRLGADTAFYLCGAATILLIVLVKLGITALHPCFNRDC